MTIRVGCKVAKKGGAVKGLIAATGVVLALVTAPHASADCRMRVRTMSEATGCMVTSGSAGDMVDCQGHFDQGKGSNLAYTYGDGHFKWGAGNMPYNEPATPMPYGQPITCGNWSIYPDWSGTKFTNTRTGHGMFVSTDNVYAF